MTSAGASETRREPAAEFRAGGTPDSTNEPTHDVAEQFDLVVGEPAGTTDEEIGDAAQDVGAARWIPVLHHVLEFADQMSLRAHQATFLADTITASRSSSEYGTGRPNR